MQPEMTMRDHFAAAALTGLLAQGDDGSFSEESCARAAYRWADAMLRERGKLSASDSTAHEGDSCRGGGDCPLPDNAANNDAAPEATAPEPEPSAARRRPAGGTGDVVHGAAPAARASVDSVAPQPTTHGDSDRTDKAAPRPSEGTGDTPVTEPMPKEKRAEVSAEPVAWAALRDDGDIAWIGYTPDGAADGACGRQIVQLFRSPTLTDAEREAVEWAAREADQWEDDEPVPHQHAATLRGLLERLGGGR